MSESQLIEAYIHGGISRRVFIRGLLAAGVSVAAALAYADTIAPSAHGATPGGAGYGLSGGAGGVRYGGSGGAGGSGTSGGSGGGKGGGKGG
jgi:hypothetical protein